MKERPILFNAPMVRALLAGTKTQTRRVMRKQFAPDTVVAEVGATSPEGWQVSGHSGLWWDDAVAFLDDAVRCPYGQPGDRLWVREAWAETDLHDGTPVVTYRAGGCVAVGRETPRSADYLIREFAFQETPEPERWRPSIHMPRWASRILLEITAVRVERLQDISEADAVAEGVDFAGHTDEIMHDYSPDERFSMLWESINGAGSWNENPWVWVIEFRRVEV